MKKLVLIILLLCSLSTFATIVVENNTFYEQSTTDKKTPYSWRTKSGETYPIYVSKNGSFYIIKISKKTNKPYKYYLPKEIQKQIKSHVQKII